MDKEMLLRAERSLDKRRLQWSEEDAEERSMTGYHLTNDAIEELERRYPKLMREIEQYTFRESLTKK